MTRYLAITVVLMAPAALGAEKLAVPPDATLEGPLAVIKEVYGEEHANARTNEQLQALAKKLFSEASKTAESIERYALLQVSRDMATQGCDGRTAFQIIDEMDRTFQVDAVRMKASVLYSLTKKARLPADRKSIAEQALALVDQAVVNDDFELAGKLMDMALSVARKVRDPEFVKQISTRNDEVKELGKSFSQVKAAIEKLQEDPTDSEANLAVGWYRCVVKGDWQNGLPMLALGSDAVLKDLAVKELREVTKPEEQLELADAWWDLAEQREGSARQLILLHAADWYTVALPSLSGLSGSRVEKRLAQIRHEAAPRVLWLADIEPDQITVLGPRLVPASPEEAVVAIRRAFSVNGVPAKHGLWAHPSYPGQPSRLVFDIQGVYSGLSGVATLSDDSKMSATALIFEIRGDGESLWKSKGLRTRNDSQSFKLGVSSVKKLELIIHCPGSNDSAHAVWWEPLLIR